MSLFANPISWSPSNMSQHCPQSMPDSNSQSFWPRKSSTSSPLRVNCQKIISDGQIKKVSFRRFSFWNRTAITYGCGNGKIFTMLRILHANFVVAMVFRDRFTVVDVWFGSQVDGKFSLKILNWPQFRAVKREFRGSISLWVISVACLPQFLRGNKRHKGNRLFALKMGYFLSSV